MLKHSLKYCMSGSGDTTAHRALWDLRPLAFQGAGRALASAKAAVLSRMNALDAGVKGGVRAGAVSVALRPRRAISATASRPAPTDPPHGGRGGPSRRRCSRSIANQPAAALV